jgi:glycosyltransferase involved in cell wall biosynthesis
MNKICFVLTTEFSVNVFLLNHLRELTKAYAVTVIVNTNNPNFLIKQGIRAKVIPLAIARDVSLVSDFSCLIQLIKVFHQQNFLAVHSVTPKAALLSMLAAWIVRIPLRIHTFTGQVWATKSGSGRLFLKWFDWLIASLTTSNIIDSPSQKQFLINQGVLTEKKSIVFAKGSISGIDVSRFKPNEVARANIRNDLKLAEEDVLFLFIGRLTVDKGVLDLAKAFVELNDSSSHLLFVGPDEQDMKTEIGKISGSNNENIHFVGHTANPESYMASAEVLCLPSYREGFGTVLIEAAAVGIPAIASRIYGITDAVVDGKTGLLHEPRDISSIKHHMESLIHNKALRAKLGKQAKERVLKDFNSDLITKAWVGFYQETVGV